MNRPRGAGIVLPTPGRRVAASAGGQLADRVTSTSATGSSRTGRATARESSPVAHQVPAGQRDIPLARTGLNAPLLGAPPGEEHTAQHQRRREHLPRQLQWPPDGLPGLVQLSRDVPLRGPRPAPQFGRALPRTTGREPAWHCRTRCQPQVDEGELGGLDRQCQELSNQTSGTDRVSAFSPG